MTSFHESSEAPRRNPSPPDSHFTASFLNICAPDLKERIVEKNKVLPADIVQVIKECQFNTSEKQFLFEEAAVVYFEAVLRDIYASFHTLYCPGNSTVHSYDDLAVRQFDLNVVQKRLECVIKCTVQVVSHMPGWKASYFEMQCTSDLIISFSAFVYFLIIYPVYNFIDGSPNYYEARQAKMPSNDVRRFFGFWLNYFHNMQVDFSEMALMLAISFFEGCRALNVTYYDENSRISETILRSALRNYSTTRIMSNESIKATDRWVMLNRNLDSIFTGIFESGKLFFSEIGSKLLQPGSLDILSLNMVKQQDPKSAFNLPSNQNGASPFDEKFISGDLAPRRGSDENQGEESNDREGPEATRQMSTSPNSSPHGSGSNYSTSPEEMGLSD